MYRTIDAALWTDPKLKGLAPLAKFLFIYFITNHHSHVSGIYYISRTTVAVETNLRRRDIDTLCDTLSSAGLVRFDLATEVVWVVNMLKYQGRGEKNVKSAACHVFRDLHKSTLIIDFLANYPAVKAKYDDLDSDRVSKGYPAQDVGATPENGERRTDQENGSGEATAEGDDPANRLAVELGIPEQVGPKQRGEIRRLISIDGYKSALSAMRKARAAGIDGFPAMTNYAAKIVSGTKAKRDLQAESSASKAPNITKARIHQ